MQKKVLTASFAALVFAGDLQAQAPAGPAAEVQASYERLKGNVLKAADKMPADSYHFKPHPDVRTFARVVNHISEAQQGACSAMLGTKPGVVPPETADKETIVAALKASFEVCDKAYAAATDSNLTDTFVGHGGRRSRISMLWGNYAHDDEQYAILSDYLRDKEILPPTSEK